MKIIAFILTLFASAAQAQTAVPSFSQSTSTGAVSVKDRTGAFNQFFPIPATSVTSSMLAAGAAAANVGTLTGACAGSTLPNCTIVSAYVTSSMLAAGAAAANVGTLTGACAGSTLPNCTIPSNYITTGMVATNFFSSIPALTIPCISGAANVACITDPQYGAKCDGSTDDATAINAAFSSSASIVRAPSGVVCVISGNVNVPSGKTFDGGFSTFRRIASGTENLIIANSVNGFTVENMTIDGNKAGNSSGAVSILIEGGSYSFNVKNIKVVNAKSFGAIDLSGTGDGTNQTASYIQNVYGSNNDSAVIIATASPSVNYENIAGFNNQFGILFTDTAGEDSTMDNISMDHLNFNCNNVAGSGGLQIRGMLATGSAMTSGFTLYDYTKAPVHGLVVHNVVANSCAGYGISIQAVAVTASNFQVYDSGVTLGLGGILFDTYYGVLTNLLAEWTGPFGIELGGCVNCVFSNSYVGAIREATVPAGAAGVHYGAAINLTIDNVTVQGVGRLFTGGPIDSDGNDFGGAFPWLGTNVSIKNSTGICQTLGACSAGIEALDNFNAFYISGNTFVNLTNGTTPVGYFNLFTGTVGFGAPNVIDGSNGLIYSAPAASELIVPEGVQTINLTGTTTIDRIDTATQQQMLQSIPYFSLTAGGSGYTTAGVPPIVTFTGGGCSVEPSGTVMVAGNGVVAGVIVNISATSPHGVGCTSAPTGVISNSGGGGSGATVVAAAPGLPSEISGQTINLSAAGIGTINTGGNIHPRTGSPITTASTAIYQFVNNFGNWTQPN